MPIPTSQSFLVSLRFTLNPQVTECPYKLPAHCSSLYVLLSVHESLNAHINFPVIVRLSTFYSQSTSHWMPITTSQSFFVFLRFTVSPQVTECPYQIPSQFSSFSVLLSVHKSLNAHINFPVIVRCLTPVSTIFQLYRGGQYYCGRKPEDPAKTTDMSPVTDKHYLIMVHISPWSGFELTRSVMIGTGSCISNYNAITATTARVSIFGETYISHGCSCVS